MRSRFVFVLFCLVFVSQGSIVHADFDKGLKAFESGDLKAAASEWKTAANQGDARAQFRLGKLYEEGRGVLQDFVSAHKWYNLSAAQGNEEARKTRDAVSKKMTKEELAEARKLARNWKAVPPSKGERPATATSLKEKSAEAKTPAVRPAQTPAEGEKTEKPGPPAIPKAIVVDVQRMLGEQGFDPGPADGAPGRRTIAAVEAFQEREGMQVDGEITRELVKRLYRTILQERVNALKSVELLRAAEKGDIKNIKRLIKAGAKVNFQDKDGWTPLLYASMAGHIDTIKLLIKSGADVNIPDKNGNTPLMAAVISNDQTLTDLLIQKDANLNCTNFQGINVVTMARIKGNTAFVDLFKNAGYQEPFTNTIGMNFVYIPPGTFMMGSPPNECPYRMDDEKQHRVTLTKGFYIQTTEVTQGQWKAIMDSNPSYFKDCGDDCPVENVSWYHARYFIRKLNGREGIKRYRLPTEAEWEYACRAGTDTPFSFGRCLSTYQANYEGVRPLPGCPKGKNRGKPIPVASLLSNAWGLYDMHGNVGEWCQDWKWDYPPGSVDPIGIAENELYRVVRGGSWNFLAAFCRSAHRGTSTPDSGHNWCGFRVIKDLTEKPSKPSGYEKLNARVTAFKFYERGSDSLPMDKRIYTNRFDRKKTRYIMWELHLSYPKRNSRVDFKIDELIIWPDAIVTEQEYTNDAPADWTGGIYSSYGVGRSVPGHVSLKAGTYRIEMYDVLNMIAKGSFEIY